MQMLKAKLYLLKQQENAEKASGIRGEVKEIGWGNQIRSYVMQPYTMVKDHRTNAETGNVDSVMDGNIDLFINAYLKWISVGGTAEEEASAELLGVCVSELSGFSVSLLSGAWLSLLSGLVVSSSGVIRLSGTVTVAGVLFASLLYTSAPPSPKRLSPSKTERMMIIVFFFFSTSAHSFTLKLAKCSAV